MKKCLVCHSKTKPAGKYNFYQPVIKKFTRMTVLKCLGSGCQHSFQDNVRLSDIHLYYKKMNRYINRDSKNNTNYLRERLKFITDNLRASPIQNFLEIGPYNDKFLRMVKAKHKYFNEKNALSKKILEKTFKFYDLGSKKGPEFDLIAMSHVFEHIDNPSAFLKTVHTKLADRGYLVLEVPDHSYFCDDAVDLPIFEHLQFFNVKSLALLLERNDFNILSVQRSIHPDNFTCQNWVIRILAQKRTALVKDLQSYWDKETGKHLQMIRKSIKGQGKIILWGISERLYLLFGLLRSNEFKKIILVDGKKKNAFYKQNKIYNPDNCPVRNVPHIFICTDSVKTVSKDIKKYKFSCRRQISFFSTKV